ncbi:MAG: transposase [Candidatus Synoicihabitans palmerolidicus]|nr:transposase [Candidatus Synoicihabitans palmerolidicus]
MIETEHPKLSVARQCELLELPRSTYYHHPKPPKEADLALMKQIDEIYLESPFFGSRQMTRWLQREGHVVNRKRVWDSRRSIKNRVCRRKRPLIRSTRICCER